MKIGLKNEDIFRFSSRRYIWIIWMVDGYVGYD